MVLFLNRSCKFEVIVVLKTLINEILLKLSMKFGVLFNQWALLNSCCKLEVIVVVNLKFYLINELY